MESLKLGSICIVMKYPSPQYFVGEFIVKEVRKLNAKEYEGLRNLIHVPQELRLSEEVLVIFFDDKFTNPLFFLPGIYEGIFSKSFLNIVR